MKVRNRLYISVELAKLIFLCGLAALFVSLYATDITGARRVFLMDIGLPTYQQTPMQLQRGEILHLEPEYSDSGTDIKVINRSGKVLGYVPKTNTTIPRVLMDQNIHLKAVVRRVSLNPDRSTQVKIAIFQIL